VRAIAELRPKPGLIGCDFLADRSVVIDILCHHLQHGRKLHKRKESGVEPLLLSCVIKLFTAESRVVGEPVVHVKNFLWIR
jgi:hypothetical protein